MDLVAFPLVTSAHWTHPTYVHLIDWLFRIFRDPGHVVQSMQRQAKSKLALPLICRLIKLIHAGGWLAIDHGTCGRHGLRCSLPILSAPLLSATPGQRQTLQHSVEYQG